MRLISNSTIIILLFFNCRTDIEFQTWEIEPLADVLTLELSFGDEKTITKDEFLLAKPSGCKVANNGDILVMDEISIKIFDMKGQPKQIVGRYGEGPGEFLHNPLLTLTETGLIAARSGGLVPRINFYTPDYKLINSINLSNDDPVKALFKEHNWVRMFYNVIYYYTPDESIGLVQARGSQPGDEWIDKRAIIYRKGDEVIPIEIYNDKKYRIVSVANPIYENGSLMLSLISDRKFIYANTRVHRSNANGIYSYTIFIYDLKTHTQESITKAYNPVAIPDSVIYIKRDFSDWRPRDIERQEQRDKERGQILKDIKIYAPIQRIYTDNQYIFVVTYEYVKDKGFFVDVFDSEKCEYINSVYFPFIPSVIKNEYAYQLKRTTETEFAEIKKYKINPAVYGK